MAYRQLLGKGKQVCQKRYYTGFQRSKNEHIKNTHKKLGVKYNFFLLHGAQELIGIPLVFRIAQPACHGGQGERHENRIV